MKLCWLFFYLANNLKNKFELDNFRDSTFLEIPLLILCMVINKLLEYMYAIFPRPLRLHLYLWHRLQSIWVLKGLLLYKQERKNKSWHCFKVVIWTTRLDVRQNFSPESCCVLVLCVLLCCSVCWFLYGPFCHGAYKVDIFTMFKIFFLLTSLQFKIDYFFWCNSLADFSTVSVCLDPYSNYCISIDISINVTEHE